MLFTSTISHSSRGCRKTVVLRQKKIGSIRDIIQKLYGLYFLDNTRMYAINMVADDQLFPLPDGTQVQLRYGQTVTPSEMDNQTIEMIGNIILQRILRDSDLLRQGRCHYEPDKETVIKVNVRGFQDLKMWPGYQISIHAAMGNKLRLEIDTKHRLLETKSVRAFMDHRWETLYHDLTSRDQNMTEEQFLAIFYKNIRDELIGKNVLTLYNKRVYRIDDVDFSKGIADTFPTENGKEISFQDHLKQRYNVDSSSVYKGILVNLPKMRKQDQGDQRYIGIVPEVAYLTGYSKAMRSNRKLTKQLSDQTRISSEIRFRCVKRLSRSSKPLLSTRNCLSESARQLSRFRRGFSIPSRST